MRLLFGLAVTTILVIPLPVSAHGGTASVVPFEVCADQELGDACQWDDGHGSLHIGTCRGVAPSLRCVRNQPMVTVPSTEVHESDGEHTQSHATHEHATSTNADSTNMGLLAVFALGLIASLGYAWKRLGSEASAA